MKSLIGSLIVIWVGLGYVSPSFSQSNQSANAYGNVRSYLILEDQAKSYPDHRTLALGGWIGYQHDLLPDVKADVAFYHSQRIWSTNLESVDPITGKNARYALGLYNVQKPSQDAVTLLGKLNLQFDPGNHSITVGRFLAKTPFLNPEDGRMIPTLVQGLQYGYDFSTRVTAQFYYLNGFAPRSTGRWYGQTTSLGTYSTGLNSDGTPARYDGNVSSQGMLIGSVRFHNLPIGSISLWNYRLMNVFNLSYLRASHTIWEANPWQIKMSLEGFWEQGIGDGGSSDPSLRYIAPDHQTWGAGLETMITHNRLSLIFAGLRIGPSGRFLFPREWGREPFFVFQKRERVEGTGDLWAYVSRIKYEAKPLQVSISYGFQDRPPADLSELNKYALGDYHHVNIELKHTWQISKESALGVELLYTQKWNGMHSSIALRPGWEYNKVNLSLYHLVLNYSF